MIHDLSVFQFFDDFAGEEMCVFQLEEIFWTDGAIQSPYGGKGAYRISTRLGYYKCKETRRNFSIRHGTIFQDSKLPLRKWFMALYILMTSKHSVSSIEMGKQLGITQKTAWFMMMRLRKAMETESFRKPLKGTVEIDEHYSGGKKRGGKRGRGAEKKTPILGMIERNGEVRCEVVPNCKKETLLPLIQKHTNPDETAYMTDDFSVYKSLDDLGYARGFVNHSKKEYVKDGFIHTNTIEGFWSHLKLGIKAIHVHVSRKHLQRYCDERSFYYNRRSLRNIDRIKDCLKNCRSYLSYRQLIADQ